MFSTFSNLLSSLARAGRAMQIQRGTQAVLFVLGIGNSCSSRRQSLNYYKTHCCALWRWWWPLSGPRFQEVYRTLVLLNAHDECSVWEEKPFQSGRMLCHQWTTAARVQLRCEVITWLVWWCKKCHVATSCSKVMHLSCNDSSLQPEIPYFPAYKWLQNISCISQ